MERTGAPGKDPRNDQRGADNGGHAGPQVLDGRAAMAQAEFTHVPVMLEEAVEALQVRADGTYLDGTLGRGGHARQVLARLRSAGKPLGEYVDNKFYRGILTGLNEAFVIDGATRAQLIEQDAKSAEIIKPFLRGRDVKRWQVQPQDLWLIFTRRGININNYPAIKKHLSTFKEQLMPKPAHWSDTTDGAWQGRKAGSYEWFEIQDNIAYWQEFGKDKIIFPDIATSPQFTFDNSGYYLANTAYVLPTTERSMVAILNSYVSTWFYAQISPQIQNGYFRFIAQYVEQIPIPEATAHQKHVLETLVDEIMISKERPKLERLMNALVYQLFFPEEFKAAGINLFQICTKIGLLNCSDNPDFQKILATIHSFPIVQTIEDIIATPKDSQA